MSSDALLSQTSLLEGEPYFKREVEEDEICSFFFFENLEIVVQSAVLVNPVTGKPQRVVKAVHFRSAVLPATTPQSCHTCIVGQSHGPSGSC